MDALSFVQPIDPETVRAFWATDNQDGDGIVEAEAAKRAAAREAGPQDAVCDGPEGQSELSAMNHFFGMDAPQRGQVLGQPIPGYSGTNRRIDADNLFGMTYAEARNAADQSQSNIDNEKGNTNKVTSTFVPGYTGMANLN